MEKPTVTLERIMVASPEAVYDAWLQPEWLGKWMFGPAVREEEIIRLENDPVPGGRFSYLVKRGDDIINHVGKYLILEVGTQLSFTWGIDGVSVDESVVNIELLPAPGGCSLILTHELASGWEAYAARTREGWTFMLGKLNGVYVAETDIPRVTAQMLIRKPALEVYHAFADPAVTRHFWFTNGSDVLEKGKTVTWTWEMYNVSTPVYVREAVPGNRIAIDWGEPATYVDFEFRDMEDGTTYVVITHYGFNVSGNDLINLVSDTAGGFTTVLDGLKAYLEHGLLLNLIADKFPKNATQHGA